MYKLQDSVIIKVATDQAIPIARGNRHYQQFLKDVAEQGTGIVEGETIIEPDYIALRTGPDGYAPIGEQMGMIAADKRNGTNTHVEHEDDVKTRYPKTILGGETIAPLPQWVVDLAG